MLANSRPSAAEIRTDQTINSGWGAPKAPHPELC
uniref:Uncharacterized protein n=1 Tax=Siphoviridae sp. ctevH2 TaxID=2825593 RepID=A0A8S5UAN9_9CAUD|nr:MAG TPA: hypothetical protein [Siphoviridae sp. ctevH2]